MNEVIALLALTLAAGCATTYVWRFIGVFMTELVGPEAEILIWVRSVATAIVAALVARIIIAPPGMLAATTLEARLAAMAVGIAGFYLMRRRTGAGVVFAVGALLALSWITGT